MIDFSQFDSLIAMTMYFNNDDTCRKAIIETRWGRDEQQDVVCPYCGRHHCAMRNDGKFRCKHCKRNFSCKVGTIFEDSNLSLVKWFIAMYLISSHKKGIVVEKTDRTTLEPIVGQFIANGSTVFTDELNSYNHLSEQGYNHKICNHGALQFVCDGEVYTNNIEGFWSHFRRMITGCYHDVSDEHLQSYIDEACFRWNTRKMNESERFAHMFHTSIGLIKDNKEFVLCHL